MRRRRCTGCLAAVVLAAGIASATTAPMPAAPPDTALATFFWTGGGPEPRGIRCVPDEAVFGDEILVVLDLDDGAVADADSLAVDVPWIEASASPENAAMPSDLPDWSGDRLVIPCRIYRVGPWRAAWRDGVSAPAAVVSGRVTNPEAMVPVRDPHAVGGAPVWTLIAAAVIVAAFGIWLLVRRRVRREHRQPTDRPLPPPAWLAAAVALRDLDRTDPDRIYLDGLAGIMRRFVAGRFLIAAEEMAAAEILGAAERAGWPRPALRGFARLIADCDAARYAPGTIGAVFCRDHVNVALDLIEDARIQPTYTPVPEDLRREAAAAWQDLRSRHPRREPVAGRLSC